MLTSSSNTTSVTIYKKETCVEVINRPKKDTYEDNVERELEEEARRRRMIICFGIFANGSTD